MFAMSLFKLFYFVLNCLFYGLAHCNSYMFYMYNGIGPNKDFPIPDSSPDSCCGTLVDTFDDSLP